jgi:peptidoglycan/LPS O-acetylase OafA/YrhL
VAGCSPRRRIRRHRVLRLVRVPHHRTPIADDRVDYKRFYWNRAVRLIPALVLALVGFVVLFERWEPVLWVAGYATNFGQLTGGDVGALGHAWSLAVEEHFYLVWPLVIGFTPRPWRWRIVLAVFVAAVGWRVWMSATGEFWRVAIGTDTAAYALVAGCVLAVAHHERRLKIPSPVVTLTAVAGVAAAASLIPHTHWFLWMDLPVVGLAMLAVAGSLRPVPVVDSQIFVWFGTVSYGLYLWHFLLLQSRLFHPAIALGVSVVVAWLSHVLVEQPIRRRLRLRPRREDAGLGSRVVTEQPSGLVGTAGEERRPANRRQLEPSIRKARI